MIAFNEVIGSTSYFKEVCQKAVGILRYCGLTDAVNLRTALNKANAKILSDISKLTADLRLSADIIVKEQESELFPVLSDILTAVQTKTSVFDNCANIMNSAKRRVDAAVNDKLNIPSGSAIVDYRSEINKLSNEAEFRDAKTLYNILGTVNLISSAETEMSKNIETIEAIYPKFAYRHYNILMAAKLKITDKKGEQKQIRTMLDACDIGTDIVKYKNMRRREEINAYLNKDMDLIINDIRDMYIKIQNGSD